MRHIISVKYLSGYTLSLVFDDGKEASLDFVDQLYGEVYEPLKNIEEFKKVKLDPIFRTISWSNGADFAPEFLYDLATISNSLK